jgi:putative component of toxin-antitoxin plasmid stabilization module
LAEGDESLVYDSFTGTFRLAQMSQKSTEEPAKEVKKEEKKETKKEDQKKEIKETGSGNDGDKEPAEENVITLREKDNSGFPPRFREGGSIT